MYFFNKFQERSVQFPLIILMYLSLMIWTQRNARIHNDPILSEDKNIWAIKNDVRARIATCKGLKNYIWNRVL